MRRAVIVPADLHRTAGLVARDLLREGVGALAAGRAHDHSQAGDAVFVDLGDAGERADEVARRVLAFTPDTVELLVPGGHGRAGAILSDALEAHGLPVELRLVDAVDLVAPADAVCLPMAASRSWLTAPAVTRAWCLPAIHTAGPADRRASPLPPGLHLGDDDWLDAVTAWVATHRPTALGEWRCLLHDHDAGVAPVAAVYAGLHLRDRNAELLVNIL